MSPDLLMVLQPSPVAGVVLTSTFDCVFLVDECGQCGGTNMLCKGCDGVVNSGATIDECGVCAGRNDCAGCDGVPFSGLELDVCGVCNGTNACDEEGPSNATYPNIEFNMTVKNAPGSRELTAFDRVLLRRIVGEVVGLDVQSVDLLGISDAPASKGNARRSAPEGRPTDMVRLARSVLGLAEGEGVCDRATARWSGCEQNVGDWWHGEGEDPRTREEEEEGEAPGAWGGDGNPLRLRDEWGGRGIWRLFRPAAAAGRGGDPAYGRDRRASAGQLPG